MKNYLNILSGKIIHGLESFFAWYGRKVAMHPFISILFCFVITGAAMVGIINYREENNAFKLWIPDNSDFVTNNEWLESNAPMDIRFNSLIMTAPNILDPAVIRHISEVKKKVDEFKTDENKLGWGDICFKRDVPKFSIPPFKSDEPDIPYPGVCAILESIMTTACFETSILEFWPKDFDFSKLTSIDDVIETVNNANAMSSTFNVPITIEDYIGGAIQRNDGKVTSASATTMNWFGHINFTIISDTSMSMGTGEVVDDNSLEWEKKLEEVLLADRDALPAGVESYVNVARGYSDVAGDTIVGDAFMMPVGFLIVFVYVTIMLGKFTCTEQRGLLALGGIGCIGLTIGFTYGFCSAVGLFYSPMHSIIPFLLLGIGVDDMFVIMQCYDNLGNEKTDDIIENVSLTLKHAGVAITVTSFTDFIVFALGATTVLPALRSFCLWCSVGIIIVYFFQATLFTALVSLDCRRLAGNRNGLCPCYVHKRYTEKNLKVREFSFAQKGFSVVSKFILSIPGTIVTLAVTFALLGVGIWGMTELKQEFDPVWFLPPKSDIFKWFEKNDELFPKSGVEVTVYITEINWDKDFDKVGLLIEDLNKENDIIARVDDWYDNILAAKSGSCKDYESSFNALLTCFLFSSPTGFASQPNFEYRNSSLFKCGEPAPEILLGKFTFTHQKFNDRDEHVDALNRMKDIMNTANDRLTGGGHMFVISREYSDWETDDVITEELFRNLGLALACVFVTTLILLADFMGSLYVLVCVGMTLVNLCGYMHFWGLTIDVVSSVNVIIAIGLCVDYSAHICHTFLTISGQRRERSEGTLVNIGPAVLNGGISTFIAFILLAGSDSHVFGTFFKIFFLVVVFGVFHGLFFFPVLLRWIGPGEYPDARPYQAPGKKQVNPEKPMTSL